MKKKSLFIAMAVALGVSLNAAEITVSAPVKVDVDQATHHPVLSPDGKTVLFSNVNYQGLNSINLESKEVKVIDESRLAGLEPMFSKDGSEITYRSRVDNTPLVKHEVKSYRLRTGEKTQLVKASRKAINLPALTRKTFATSEFTQINVTIDGVSNIIKPIANGYTYQWPSISPAGNKLMFAEAYTGVWVSELDGTKAKNFIPRGIQPCWINDDFVLALVTKDDGYVVKEAKVVAVEIATGKTTQLTPDDVLVGGVTASADKVVYTTEDGKMYIMNVTITK